MSWWKWGLVVALVANFGVVALAVYLTGKSKGWWECRECGAMFAPVAALAPAELTRLRAEVETLKARNAELEAKVYELESWSDAANLTECQEHIAKLEPDLAAKTAELERVRAEQPPEWHVMMAQLESLGAALSAATARAEKAEGEVGKLLQQLADFNGRELAALEAENAAIKNDVYKYAFWKDRGWDVLMSQRDAAESQLREARVEIEKLRELVRRAIEDGWKCPDEASRALTGGPTT